MGEKMRTLLSPKNKYYISKNRRKELEYFSKQYFDWYVQWRELATTLDAVMVPSGSVIKATKIEKRAISENECIKLLIQKDVLERKMHIVEDCCARADFEIREYIFSSVTKGKSFVELSQTQNMPCGKDKFYKGIHKYFWLLDKAHR